MASFTFDDYLREMRLSVEKFDGMDPVTQERYHDRYSSIKLELLKLNSQTQTEEQFDRYQTQTEEQFDRFSQEIQERLKSLEDLMTQKSVPGNIHLRWHSIIP